MREQGNEAQDRDDLELELVAAMGHTLRQTVQPKEQEAERYDRDQQKHRRDDRENVCIAGGRDEDWHVVGRSRVNLRRHGDTPNRETNSLCDPTRRAPTDGSSFIPS